MVKAEVCTTGRIDVSRSGKSHSVRSHTAFLQKLEGKKNVKTQLRLPMNYDIFALTRENKAKIF